MYVLQDVQCTIRLGIVVFYVKDVFMGPKCQVSTGLAYCMPCCMFYISACTGLGNEMGKFQNIKKIDT